VRNSIVAFVFLRQYWTILKGFVELSNEMQLGVVPTYTALPGMAPPSPLGQLHKKNISRPMSASVKAEMFRKRRFDHSRLLCARLRYSADLQVWEYVPQFTQAALNGSAQEQKKPRMK